MAPKWAVARHPIHPTKSTKPNAKRKCTRLLKTVETGPRKSKHKDQYLLRLLSLQCYGNENETQAQTHLLTHENASASFSFSQDGGVY